MRPNIASRLVFQNTFRSALSLLAAFLLSICASSFASAASLQEAQNLLRQGQNAQALEQTEKLLVANPKDRSAHFLKGVILTEMNRLDEAIVVFTALTQEAPELPEPYNNLAVIYAQQKQYDKAKAALEMAIRTHPSYAIAHENLGDLYSKMARQAYDRALQIDASNATAQTKLSLIREIISVGARGNTAVASAGRPPTTVVANAAPAPAPAKPVEPPPAPAVVAKPVTPPVTAPAPVAQPTPATATPVTKPIASAPVEAKPAAASPKSDDAEIRKAVEAWADAWSRKDMRGYLGAYARDFQVPGGASRKAWEKERSERVGKPGAIKVVLSDIKIDSSDNKATVRFRQHYTSTNLTTASGKTLVMVEHNGRWQIQQEKIGR